MTPQKVPTGPDVTTDGATHSYPGGDEAVGYRRVFDLWVLMFLGVICLGLVNYLGVYAKSF